MAQARRSTDRRRRVLYQAHSATTAPSTPASRRAAEKLRAARQPAKAFGSRVGQPLRGRWFSLVPSSTLAMTAVAAVLCIVPTALALLHHLSFSWPALAYETDVARPLQINRTDSFASWWTSIVLLLSAGVSILIFQLRRHRSDDFRGHYRLWRMVLIILVAASLHYTIDLVGWVGAVLDLGFGDRAVLSGAKWLRIVMDVGGIIIAMQLIAEVVRCRASLVAMIAACVCFAVLELAFWNVIEIRTTAIATLVTAAPMFGFSCFLMASTVYLRALYRQVVNVSNEVSLRDRFSRWLATWRDQDIDVSLPEMEPAAARNGAVARVARTETTGQPAAAKSAASAPAQQQTSRQATTIQKAKPVAATKPSSPLAARRTAETTAREETIDKDEPADMPKRGLWSRLTGRSAKVTDEAEQSDDSDSSPTDETDRTDGSKEERPKRRWLGLRAGKTEVDDDEQADETEADSNEEVAAEKPTKKPWFSLRLQPKTTEPTEDDEGASRAGSEADPQPDEEGEKKPGLLGRLLARKKSNDEEIDFEEDAESAAADQKPAAARKPGPLSRKTAAGGPSQSGQNQANQSSQKTVQKVAQQPQASGSQQAASADTDIDPDDIDWESLSKSERRRLRKQIKRSGRAA